MVEVHVGTEKNACGQNEIKTDQPASRPIVDGLGIGDTLPDGGTAFVTVPVMPANAERATTRFIPNYVSVSLSHMDKLLFLVANVSSWFLEQLVLWRRLWITLPQSLSFLACLAYT